MSVSSLEKNEEKVIGDIKHFSGGSVMEWRIPKFFSLPQKIDEYYDSSSFSFIAECWFIRMYPNGRTKTVHLTGEDGNSKGFIDLYLFRSSSGSPIDLKFSFELKTDNEKIHSSESLSKCFEKKMHAYGFRNGISRAMLLEKSKLAVSDDLVIVCKMEHSKRFQFSNYVIGPPVLDPKDKILQDLKQLYLKRDNCDVVLKVKKEEFSAHKAILTARSPVFASAFQHDMKEKATGIVDIDDCEPSIFPYFLSFLYCGEVNSFSKENIYDIFAVADKYDVSDLKSKCIEFMKENLSIETFCDTIKLAVRYSETNLVNSTADFFVQNAEKIIVTVDWQTFIKEYPTQSNELFIIFVASVKCSNK